MGVSDFASGLVGRGVPAEPGGSAFLLAAFEIKSSRAGKVPGLHAFKRIHPDARCYLVGGQGMDLATFFTTPAADFPG